MMCSRESMGCLGGAISGKKRMRVVKVMKGKRDSLVVVNRRRRSRGGLPQSTQLEQKRELWSNWSDGDDWAESGQVEGENLPRWSCKADTSMACPRLAGSQVRGHCIWGQLQLAFTHPHVGFLFLPLCVERSEARVKDHLYLRVRRDRSHGDAAR
ncbi:hypothetical protein PYCCODRAFT_1149756 [Trametes coccinea BRFM310]|uniref:Uncharacterized protein n=1 Tax=Trametes coccinea (strain BRFM310) TaxID=1353009 RepID=A0A1Y2I833_TRAC3|nr:hypothetical protein PYCCODRAFT_1149756 [Trametes coccinea BRFM310]